MYDKQAIVSQWSSNLKMEENVLTKNLNPENYLYQVLEKKWNITYEFILPFDVTIIFIIPSYITFESLVAS